MFRLDIGYRLDFVVEDVVIVEIKAVEKILPVHLAQSLSYLKLKPCPVGLLINASMWFIFDRVFDVS